MANFYKTSSSDTKNATLIAWKNIDYIPAKGTFIWISGQRFRVYEVHFNMDNCEYSLYLHRA